MNNKKTGAELIAQERLEQLTKHGRTVAYDVIANKDKQLLVGAFILMADEVSPPPYGWDETIWNKMLSKDKIGRLTTAGALIAAEIDRLNYPPSVEAMTHGLIVVDKRQVDESIDGMVDILHFCGYWQEPTCEDIASLQQELATTPEFGVMDIMEHIGIYDATPEILEEYKADIISGKYDAVPDEEIKAEEPKQ